MISSILVVARDGRPRLERRSREARSAKPSADCARPAVIAAWHQNTNGENRSADSGLSHAANFMWQRTGKKPDREDAKDFGRLLVLLPTIRSTPRLCVPRGGSTKAPTCTRGSRGVAPFRAPCTAGRTPASWLLLQVEAEVKAKGISPCGSKTDRKGRNDNGQGQRSIKTIDPGPHILRRVQALATRRTAMITGTNLTASKRRHTRNSRRAQSSIKTTWILRGWLLPDGIPTTSDDGFCRRQGGGGSAKVIEEKFAAAQEKPALYRPESGIRRHY